MSETYGCGQSACAQLTLGKPGALSWKPLSHCASKQEREGKVVVSRGEARRCRARACVACVAWRAFRLPSRNYPSRAPILPPITATSPSVPH